MNNKMTFLITNFELYKIMGNKVTFVGFREAINSPPPAVSAPVLQLLQLSIGYVMHCMFHQLSHI